MGLRRADLKMEIGFIELRLRPAILIITKRMLPKLKIELFQKALLQGCGFEDAEIELLFCEIGLFSLQLKPLLVQVDPPVLQSFPRSLT